MKHLSTVARIVTPLAMVVFLAYEINQSMTVDGWWITALLIGSIATAIGIEITGILAGKALEGFWRLGDKNRTILSLALLSVYTIVAVYILRHNQAMVLVPIIAAIVYLLSSLTDSLEMVASEQKEEAAVQVAFELEQAAADKELERELKRQKQADDTALKLARLETKTKPIETKTEKPKQETVKRVSPEVEELSGTKKLVFIETKRNPDATQQEIAEMLQEKHGISVSRQMVGKHQRSLNGALK